MQQQESVEGDEGKQRAGKLRSECFKTARSIADTRLCLVADFMHAGTVLSFCLLISHYVPYFCFTDNEP